MNLIRSNAPIEEIRLFLADPLPSNTSDEVLTEKSQNHSSSSGKYMNVNRLSDIPLYQVPAKPWTTVTDDDALVSHLISLYFTWHHSVLNCIDRDIFLRDMKSGNLDSRFCSPLLVNSILTIACVSTRRQLFTLCITRQNDLLISHSSITPTVSKLLPYRMTQVRAGSIS